MNDLPVREKCVWIIRQYILMLTTTAQWKKKGKSYPPMFKTKSVWLFWLTLLKNCSFQEEMQSMKKRFPKESKKKGKKKKHSSLQLCMKPKILWQKKA